MIDSQVIDILYDIMTNLAIVLTKSSVDPLDSGSVKSIKHMKVNHKSDPLYNFFPPIRAYLR